jgi:hypothetical protein
MNLILVESELCRRARVALELVLKGWSKKEADEKCEDGMP